MLALDPYYEMFPSSYRRSYPYWGGWGQELVPVPVTEKATASGDAEVRAKVQANCPKTALATCKSLAARPAGTVQTGSSDAETAACCVFNAFQADDVQFARAVLAALSLDLQTKLLTTMLRLFPESTDFIKRVQRGGLSTGAKIAIGVGALGVVGITIAVIARR
jgi:hypothetical protein